MMAYTNAIIADDNEFYLTAYSNLLEKNFELKDVAMATTTAEVLQHVKPGEPQIIFINALLPGGNVADVCRQILQLHPSVTIVVLAEGCGQLLMQLLMQIGVHGIIPIASPTQLIRECLEGVSKGKVFYLINSAGAHYSVGGKPEVAVNTKHVLIIQKLYEEKSTREIAAEMHLSVKTVENIRKELLVKTGSKNVVGIIKFGKRNGIVG